MGPTLPGIFRGDVDAWTLYQLATVNRLNYSSDAEGWARVRQGWRSHWSRQSTVNHNAVSFPRCQMLFFPEYQLVCIAGTSNFEDFFAGLRAAAMTMLTGPTGTGVGTGWWTLALAQWDGMVALGFDPTKPTIFSGHSLGGALAICHAYRMKQENADANVATVTFGCPRVGTAVFNAALPGFHWRVVNGLDLISSYPAAGWDVRPELLAVQGRYVPYAHSGNMVWLDSMEHRMMQASGNDYSGLGYHARFYGDPTPNSFWNGLALPEFTEGRVNQHKIFSYVTALRRLVHDVEPFQLTAFDLVNGHANGLFSEEWPDAEILLSGFKEKPTALPTDPPLPLPPPPPEVGPFTDVPLAPVPARSVYRPPTPLQLQHLQNRRRRNIG